MLDHSDCKIDDDCVGERWIPTDQNELAKMIALIAMGQAAHAAEIIETLNTTPSPFSIEELRDEAKITLSVEEPAGVPRQGYPRWQRDGFVFEAISWIAAKLKYGNNALLTDPHISATSQGVDGLMLQLKLDQKEIEKSTIFEDKCSDKPRATFLSKVIPAFQARHQNQRSAEIIAVASALLRTAGVSAGDAAALSAAVTDRTKRNYRAAFALPSSYDSEIERQKLFADYDRIDGINQSQRIAASFVPSANMRKWIDETAELAKDYIDSL